MSVRSGSYSRHHRLKISIHRWATYKHRLVRSSVIIVVLRVVRGSSDIEVVLPMSTSWMPMLWRAGSILSCASMRLGCLVPLDWRCFMKFTHHYTLQVEISPVLSGIDNKPTIKKDPSFNLRVWCGVVWCGGDGMGCVCRFQLSLP